MLEQLIAIAMDSVEVEYKNFKTYLISQKQSFLDAVKTDVTFSNPAIAREQSSKLVNLTTYDRYQKYHHNPGSEFKLGTVIETLISTVKKAFTGKHK